MNLHEYQSKELFAKYGLPVSGGRIARTADEAVDAASELGGDRWVIKVQVHAGGRGKAGGVKLVESDDEIREFATEWLGNRIQTVQTTDEGQPVNLLYIEEITDIATELYLGAVIDRATARVVVMASAEGGVEIEQVAAATPQKIFRATIDPGVGPQEFQGRQLAFRLGMRDMQIAQFTRLFMNLCRMFEDLDCSLVEINPLVITTNGDIHCLDAKVNIDSNALFRHADLAELNDPSQDDEREAQAAEFDLNYVALDGNIGCMVNGAGLAMGTMDLVKLRGGMPANFLDVGGGVTVDSVSQAFKIILADPEVKAVLINIFGGIVSCADIADGIVQAVQEVGVEVPVIVRFDGNSAEEGSRILANSGLNIIAASTLPEAAQKAVSAANSMVSA